MKELRELAQKIAAELGYDLWDVKLVQEGSLWYLRIFIDTDAPEGITLDDCERMSRAIDEPLDVLDPIEQSYFLEVCSPGLERELSTPEHFEKMAGCDIRIKLYRPIDGKKEIIATLVELSGDVIVLENEEKGRFELPKKDAASVRVYEADLF